ncbi:MAG: cytochrome c [Acidobacteriota bacterium]
MNRAVLVAVLWLGVLVSLRATLGVRPDRRSLEYFPDMAVSPAAETQGSFPALPGEMSQQLPPPETIPRGLKPLHFSRDEAGRKAAGDSLVNPYSAAVEASPTAPTTPDRPSRGQLLYTRFCVPCHGPQGRGDGPVALRGYPPPPALQRDIALQYKDGEIFHIITYGLGNMPGYGSQVAREDRWLIVNHVRTLQEAARGQEGAAP